MGCQGSKGKPSNQERATFGRGPMTKELPPAAPSTSLVEMFAPEGRREHFLREQSRFRNEVEHTRSRREAERILQCACPACNMVLGIRADQLMSSGGVVRCGRCATLFIVRVEPAASSLALPPGIMPDGSVPIMCQCPHCTYNMMAAQGNSTMCPVCLQQFIATRTQDEGDQFSVPRSAQPAVDARPNSFAPPCEDPLHESGSNHRAGYCFAMFGVSCVRLATSTPLVPLLYVRGMDPTGAIVWYPAQVVLEASVDLKHEYTDEEGGVHWVAIDNGEEEAQQMAVRSDDVEMVLKLKHLTVESLPAQPLSIKVQLVRHRFMCSQIPASAEAGPIRLELRRDQMAADVQFFFLAMSDEDFTKEIRFRLQNETDFFQDVGGVTREVYTVAAKQLFAESEGLFERILDGADGGYLRISNRYNSDQIDQATVDKYNFAGKLLGKVLMDGYTVPVPLASVLYRQLQKKACGMDELKKMDFQMHGSLVWMLHNDVNELEETFAIAEAGPLGKVVERELCKEGKQLAVTEMNKSRYVEMRAHWELEGRIEIQLKAFQQGVWSVIPSFVALTQCMSAKDLRQLWCGHTEIDVQEWFESTAYAPPCTAQDEVVQWFWTSVRGMTDEQRSSLLYFVTGSSCVPVEGFAGLSSTYGKIYPFSISTIPMTSTSGWCLPRAHTCFNRLDLPAYTSQEMLADNLLKVLEPDAMGFGMDE